jgi:hypothetical protein
LGSISGVVASPTTVAPGGTSKITPTVSGSPATDKTVTVSVSLDGASGSAQVDLHTDAEALVYSVSLADKGKPGYVVCETDTGTVTSNGDGTFTLHL